MQLALQSSCIMLSNNAKPLLSLSLGFSSGALTFTPRVKSIILTLLLKMQCHDYKDHIYQNRHKPSSFVQPEEA